MLHGMFGDVLSRCMLFLVTLRHCIHCPWWCSVIVLAVFSDAPSPCSLCFVTLRHRARFVWTLCLLSCSSISRCFTFWSEAAEIIQSSFQIRTVLNPSRLKQLENVSLQALSVFPYVSSTFSFFCQRNIKEFFNIFLPFHTASLWYVFLSVQNSYEKDFLPWIIRLSHGIQKTRSGRHRQETDGWKKR